MLFQQSIGEGANRNVRTHFFLNVHAIFRKDYENWRAPDKSCMRPVVEMTKQLSCKMNIVNFDFRWFILTSELLEDIQ